MTDEEILVRVFRNVYHISEDVRKLKKDPEGFEELRRNYQFRNENKNYILDLKNCSKKVNDQFCQLGFRLSEHASKIN